MYDKNPPENGGFVSNLKGLQMQSLLLYPIYWLFVNGWGQKNNGIF